MPALKKILIGLLIFVVLTVLAVAGYLYQQRPQYSGILTQTGVSDSVAVHFDAYGIPHIYGKNASDTYFALGYVHAQDRLFQMDILRRIGSGKLSAFFGEATLPVDRLFHTTGLPTYAEASMEQFETINPELKTIILRYIDGINHFAETGPVPLEYLIGGLPREKFAPVDVYYTAGYMAFSFALGLKTDPLVYSLYQNIGEEYVNDLAIDHYVGQALAPSGREVGEPVFSAQLRDQLNHLPIPFFSGSNSWAISGKHTVSGKPILANDTHIKYTQPSTWYEAHLEFPETRLYGNFLAGIPLPLTGHTDRHAWGLTMFENDDTDFYIETHHPDDTTMVRNQNNIWAPVKSRRVAIAVKGAPSDTLIIRETLHGPVMNEFLEVKSAPPVSMFWTYTKRTNQLPEAFYNLQQATSMDEARAAIGLIHAPGLNITYADAIGNIALWSAAHLIKRPEHVQAKTLLKGANGNDDPLGFYPFEANPQVENPPSGMVYSANSQHDTTSYGVMHPGYYTASTRMERIVNVLEQRSDWTIEAMKPLINDHHSIADRDLAAGFYSLITQSQNESLIRFFEPLKDWSGQHDINSTEPVIYYPLLYAVMAETFLDEMGPELFDAWLHTHLMKRTNFKIFNQPESIWFDNIQTEKVEQKVDVVLAAAEKAMTNLLRRYPSGKLPTWGEVHTLTFAHPMGVVAPLDRILNVGPFPMAGTNESVNQQSFIYTNSGEYPVQHGPQMRILIDMADIENSVSINPTGQSGNRFSKHYSDQSERFIHGEFRPQLMNRREILINSTQLLFID